ncbi:MAG: ABC transporter ATP-binding protein [Acidimicrobiales bacterium]
MSLEVRGVRVTLGGSPVLRGIDLDLADREVVAVLGPSGSGKTTLLRVIAGLQRDHEGAVTVDGRDITRMPPHRRGIGLMFQDHALFPHRDVAGNVGFGLKMAGMTGTTRARRVADVLELVGLPGFENRRIDGLSGGERQRVALARALAPEPSVVLLDEPLGSLDRALRDRLLDDLSDVLHASGASVVHVTHDQAEAFATGDRIVVMRDGEIAQAGSAVDVWRRPVDADVARIVGPATIVAVTVSPDGVVVAPWGAVVADAAGVVGEGDLVIRPDSLSVASGTSTHPSIVGDVVGRSFRGDHALARVRVDGTDGESVELMVSDRGDAIGGPGARVELAVVTPPVVVRRSS